MSFVERLSIFCAIAAWYFAVRSVVWRLMRGDDDKFFWPFSWFMALPVTGASLMIGAGLYRSLWWVFTGVTPL